MHVKLYGTCIIMGFKYKKKKRENAKEMEDSRKIERKKRLDRTNKFEMHRNTTSEMYTKHTSIAITYNAVHCISNRLSIN